MLFCPYCNNILNIESISNSNAFSCRTCPYVYRMCEKLVKTVMNETKKIEGVLYEEDIYKYASTCQKNCVKCNNTEALFMELQIRSADEPMTIFYECTKCKATWKEN